MDSKERIYVLEQYLKENTDEDTEVSAVEIRRMFRSRGQSVTAPTLRDDIASLRRAGMNISVREFNGVGTYYKVINPEWTKQELQNLIDAVSAWQCMSPRKSSQLIKKLKNRMAGPSLREKLKPGILISGEDKAPDSNMLNTVQRITEAVETDRRIRFRYSEDTTEKKQKGADRGEILEVSPYAMFWKQGCCYLAGWSGKDGKIARFRIDCMSVPAISKKARIPAPEFFHPEDLL